SPVLPRAAFRAPDLEHEMPAGAKRGVAHLQSFIPVVIGKKDLSHVPGHDREIETESRNLAGVAVYPRDSSGRILRLRDLKRRTGRIDPDDLATIVSEQDRKATRATTDVKHPLRTQLVGDAEVSRQV